MAPTLQQSNYGTAPIPLELEGDMNKSKRASGFVWKMVILACLLAATGATAVAQSPEGTVADFKAQGLNVEFASFPGGHEWQVWRKSLHDFAQRIF